MKFFLQFLCIFVFLSNSVAIAGEFYVSDLGNDNDNGDVLTPWQTLQHAVDSINPGDTIIVQAGTYAGFRVKYSGDQSNFCTIKAESPDSAMIQSPSPDTLNNAHIEIDTNVQYWKIQGLSISSSTSCAVYMNFVSNIKFSEIDVSNSTCGMFIKNSEHINIQSSKFSMNNGYALEIEDSENVSIFNSVFYNNNSVIACYGECKALSFANNTVYNDVTSVPMFDLSNLKSRLFFTNNIAIAQLIGTVVLRLSETDDFNVNNNVYKGKFRFTNEDDPISLDDFKNHGLDVNSLEVEPEEIFSDYQNQDFNLLDNCAVCELGVYFDEIYGINTDYAGNARIEGYFPDPGAFEASVSSSADADGDLLPNWWEHLKNLDFLDSATPDEDDDLDDLTNAEEYVAGTLPKYGDSDADGYGDGDEKAAGTDPLDQSDFPETIGITPVTFESTKLKTWFKYEFQVVNYKEPLKFQVVDGIFPPGFKLDGATGKISGYSARPGVFNFVIQVIDAEKKTDTQKVRINVDLPAETEVSGCSFNSNANDSDLSYIIIVLLTLVFVRVTGVIRKS